MTLEKCSFFKPPPPSPLSINPGCAPVQYIMSFKFLRQTVQKGPFLDFRISPYSFFNVLASFSVNYYW